MECNICSKKIDGEHRVVIVHKSTMEDHKQGAWSNEEKHLKVCNDCVVNLNFRSVESELKDEREYQDMMRENREQL